MTPPRLSQRIAPLGGGLFAALAHRLNRYDGPRYPFHIGDNAIRPPGPARWDNVDVDALGDAYAYGHPAGAPRFREALACWAGRGVGRPSLSPDEIFVSTGATHGISATLQALLDPGDEVLLLAPYWPLARGICHCAGVVPVEVPFFLSVLEDPGAELAALIEPHLTSRTRMLYVISPNNPTGAVLSRAQLGQLAAFAEAYDLWILSDEAYEAYTYTSERPHHSISTVDGVQDRVVTAHTFSKTFAMAGSRVGYVVGPRRVISALGKVGTHTVYNTCRPAQAAAMAALSAGEAWLSPARACYQQAAAYVAEHVAAPAFAAQGGSFVFVDLRQHGPDAMPILERAADRGVTLAPGAIFGAGFEGFGRLCFTTVDTPTLATGIEVLNEVLRA